MEVPLGPRPRAFPAFLAAAVLLAWTAHPARADLLVNTLTDDAPAPGGTAAASPVAGFQPHGPAAEAAADPEPSVGGLFALAAVFVMPPPGLVPPTPVPQINPPPPVIVPPVILPPVVPPSVPPPVIQSVPEPASLLTALLGVGMAGAAGIRRRRAVAG